MRVRARCYICDMFNSDYYVQQYIARINRVMDYIEKHLSEPMTLEELADVAAFSKFHFHRIFSALTGESLYEFIRRLRLERAAGLLADQPDLPVTDIVYGCGFSSQSVFNRAFRDFFGMTPTRFRRGGHLEHSKNRKQVSKENQLHSKAGRFEMDKSGELRRVSLTQLNPLIMKNVEIKDLQEMNVAYVRHTGPYNTIGEAFGKLMRWAGPRGLFANPDTRLLCVYHDSPEITEEVKLRSSVCITIPENMEVKGEIGKMKVAGGKYAMCRFEITTDQFGEAWDEINRDWLPSSGYVCDDRLPFDLYYNNAEEHPEKKHIVDICIPVRPM
ncbi:MAG: GyrI-like domain-containing protein [Bacteroidales bacterium]|nr:GyrI-like domain-containing protein [Bacteroidales bacterium]